MKTRKYMVEIEMQLREGKTPCDMCDLIKLDMYTLANPGTVPEVKVREINNEQQPPTASG